MVYNINNFVYGVFPQGPCNSAEKMRCIQISRLWSQSTSVGDKDGGKEKQVLMA